VSGKILQTKIRHKSRVRGLSWEVGNYSPHQHITAVKLKNPTANNRHCKSPILDPIQSKFSQVHNLYLNPILTLSPSTSMSTKWFLSMRFTKHNFVCISRLPVCIMPCFIASLDLHCRRKIRGRSKQKHRGTGQISVFVFTTMQSADLLTVEGKDTLISSCHAYKTPVGMTLQYLITSHCLKNLEE
jgi:hypothetical protein